MKTKTIILSITPQTWVPFDRNKTVLFRIPEECKSRHRVTGLEEDRDKPCDMYLGGETYCYHLNEEGEKVLHTLSKVGRSIVRRVKRYNEYKDALWDLAYDKGFKYPKRGLGITFYLPVPKRWTNEQKRHAHMTPHENTPDLINLTAALEDALLTQDKGISYYSKLEKKWVNFEQGWIELSVPTREKQETMNVSKFANDDLSNVPNFPDVIMYDFYRATWRKWENALKVYLKDNLKMLGYEFSNEGEFFEFCKSRVHRMGFTSNPDYHEYYLDYKNEEDRGTFIGSSSHKINIDIDSRKLRLTATIG